MSKTSSEVTAHVSGSVTKTISANKREELPVIANPSVSSTRTTDRGIVETYPCEPSRNMRKTSLMPHISLKNNGQPSNQIIGKEKAREKKNLVFITSEV